MLHEQTREHITGLTDEQLTQYLAVGTDAYEVDAVAFAREQFAARNLDRGQLAVMESHTKSAIAASKAHEAAIAATPLDITSRFLAFIFGWAILTPVWFIIWFRLERAG